MLRRYETGKKLCLFRFPLSFGVSGVALLSLLFGAPGVPAVTGHFGRCIGVIVGVDGARVIICVCVLRVL